VRAASSSRLKGNAVGRITVVVPTANRPELLPNTLRSIARQSVLDQVDEVIVSENLGCVETALVCDQFPELPITFVMQDPPLGVLDHVAFLLTRGRSEFVAMLCDDDWWTPGHLENALTNLDRTPAASAHLSCYVAAGSELPATGVFWGAGATWLAAGRPDPIVPFVLDLPRVTALCWAFTPFTFSSLVARREMLPLAVEALRTSPHTYYADRLLYPALAKQGPIVYEPMVDTYYRSHVGNWQSDQDEAILQSLLRDAADHVIAEAAKEGIDPPALWREYLTDVPPAVLSDVSDLLRGQLGPDLLARNDLEKLLTPLDVPPPPPPLHRRVASALRRRFRRTKS
jgi:glycosyltransferase involved in cell wall biosynthesis